MRISMRGISRLIVALVVLALGAQSGALAQKGRKISLSGHPSMKQGSPAFVLVEVSDFQ
ncbi:MAG TPA: hypothetical protein VFC23_20750 [Thermoanaerobaculia bacterium]|nr:hypothetical protein [Thermoanaerobaculia bacterium]